MSVAATKPECEVCENELENGGWGVKHGEGICAECGAVYDFNTSPPKCLLDGTGKEIAHEYYEETGEPAVLIPNDGVSERQVEQFNEWYENSDYE